MAIVYHRDQAGAPALVYQPAANNIAHFTAVKTVLKACLVSGYGVQAAAGWELISEGANYIVLRNGTHTGYLGLTWAAGVIRVYLSETYTGMSGDVMTGDGLKTGTAAGSSLPQVIASRYLAHSAANTCWTMVADARTFTLSMVGDTANRELYDASYNGFTLYAGEDSAERFLALGGYATASTNANNAYGYFSSSTGMTVLKDPATGLLVSGGAIDVVTPALMRTTADLGFSQIVKFANAQLNKIAWVGSSVLSGTLRGIAGVADLANALSINQAAQCLGRESVMNYRDANSALDLGDAHTYLAAVTHRSSFVLLTDNPAFW